MPDESREDAALEVKGPGPEPDLEEALVAPPRYFLRPTPEGFINIEVYGPTADAVKRAEEEVFETPEEREVSEGDRYGMAADNRIARRAGEASIKDVDRLSEL